MKSAQSLSYARRLFTLVAIVLLASALRARDLSLMTTMVHYDEAYYGVDALSLLEQPRLTPFFPENFGRESLWMYALTPTLAAFGGSAFALRITAFFTGILTIAAVYRLGRELFGVRAGIGSAAVLAVLFWHVLAGHQAFRAHLYPLVGALAFALLLRARRVDSWHAWAWAGGAFGALAYTYIAARGWLVLGAVMAVWFTLTRWKYANSGRPMGHPYTSSLASFAPLRFNPKPLLAIMIAALIAFPLVIELLANPALAGQRTEQVSIRTLDQLAENLTLWARAWVVEGSGDVAYNLPGRPILDLPLVIFALLGVIAATLIAIQKSPLNKHFSIPSIFLLFLAAASLAPAVLTTDTLKPLRAVGVVVPLAIALGAGAAQFSLLFKRHTAQTRNLTPNGSPKTANRTALQWRGDGGEVVRNVLQWLPIGILLAWAAINSARDFSTWVRSPDLYLPMEQHIYAAIDEMVAFVPPDAPIYFAPFTPAHPVIRLRQDVLAPRSISAFEPGKCLRLPDAPHAYYFALTLFDPGFPDRLRPYADVESAMTEQSDTPRWTIYRAQPHDDLFQEQDVVFGDRIAVRLVQTQPEIAPAAAVPLTAIARAVAPLDRAYTLFVHVYGNPTPYEGGTLWGQADAPFCTSSPPQTWRMDEVIIQPVTLSIAPELPAGEYTLAVGIYDTLTGERLTTGDTETYALVSSLVNR
ncbi:MAG: hypothetical protein SF123_05095 [Chloroflexota bacterium]|nr:hypothetical protein [Chloroflexota bacterium]